jgi:hypothetical protein
MTAPQPHRRRAQPQEHADRLLQILRANLARTRDPDLRERLERAIVVLKERTDAGAG